MTPATDRLLHGVAHIRLPVEVITAILHPPVVVPPAVFRDEGRQQRRHPLFPSVHEVAVPDARCRPLTVEREFRHALTAVAVIPRVDDAIEPFGITQPAAFMDMVTQGRGDEVILVRIAPRHEKLCHPITHRSRLDMLEERPPPEIIDLLHLLVGTIEKWDVLTHPGPSRVALSKGIGIMLVVVTVEQRQGTVSFKAARMHPHDGPRRIAHGVARLGQDTIPIGRRVDVRHASPLPRPETDTLHGSNGRHEDAAVFLRPFDRTIVRTFR